MIKVVTRSKTFPVFCGSNKGYELYSKWVMDICRHLSVSLLPVQTETFRRLDIPSSPLSPVSYEIVHDF
jgi:hypothetical protein